MSLENKMKISYEEMLFRYGLSCADNLLYLKKISKEDYETLYDFAEKRKVPSLEFVERVFSEAVKRIGQKKTGEAVDEYFRKRHNEIIDKKEGNYSKLNRLQCESCKTFEGKIIKIKQEFGIPIYIVEVGNKKEKVFGKYLWDKVKIGDYIVVHNYSAVRKL